MCSGACSIFMSIASAAFSGFSMKSSSPMSAGTTVVRGTACRSILVIGVLKQGINCDFDRLRSLVNNHELVRAMLGHDDVFDCGEYEMQTLVDDVSLLTPRMPARVGKLLAASGHEVAGKKLAPR